MKKQLEQILMGQEVLNVKYLESNKEYLFSIIPELMDEDGFDQRSPWHIYDVWKHTEVALSYSNNDLEERIALLLHDIGKPHSCQEDGEVRHFKGHAEKSAEISRPILERLGYDGQQIDFICWLIGTHSATIDISEVNEQSIERMKKRLSIQYCDCRAYNPEYTPRVIARLDDIKDKMSEIERSFQER